MYTKISDNLNRILTFAAKFNPTIIAVSKYYTVREMEEAYKVGLNNFGENKVLDAIEKINLLEEEIASKSHYHLIGHLQSNKVKKAVGVFDLIHSVDSLKLAVEIDNVAKQKGIIQKILIQVNNANEEQKFGIAPSHLEELIEKINVLQNVRLEGLMTIAPLTDDETLLRKLFCEMYQLKEKFHLKELSMGMSNDYKIALEEGATMIRLGRTLFE